MKKLLVVAALFCFAAGLFAQAKPLQYHYEVGQKYAYQVNSETKMSQEVMGREMLTESNSESNFTLNPQKIMPDGAMVLHASYSKMVNKVHSANIDTTLEMKDLYGKRVQMTVKPDGKVTEISTVDSLVNTNFMMRGMADPKTSLSRVLVRMPPKPMAIGDSWMHTEVDTMRMENMEIIIAPNTEYKILAQEMNGGMNCYKISFSGPFTLNGKGSQMGAEFFIDGTGKSEGIAYFALDKGVLVSVENTMNQDMTIAITGAANMTIPQTQNVKTKLLLLP